MSDTSRPGGGRAPITLDQLIALNDEVLALTRAGMPLERGLTEAGSDLPGRLRTVTQAVGERLGRGESLAEALESVDAGVPPVYRAVVEAGVRSGRLPIALEGLATYARGYAEARGSIGLALLYPVIVMSLAFGLFLFLMSYVVPKFEALMADLGIAPRGLMRVVGWFSGAAPLLWPVLPVGLLVLLFWWRSTRRAVGLQGGRPLALLRRFPWMGRMLSRFEASSFAELLALLVENGVPYPAALRLAGEASGDPALIRSSGRIAESIERGEPVAEALKHAPSFPPLLRWVVATGQAQGDLPGSLRRMAGQYRSDARFQADKIRVLMPTFLMLALGATATALYALALFGPLTSLWTSLSQPIR